MEDNYKIIAVGEVRVRSVENGSISSISMNDRERVESIWQDAQKQRKNELFNGTLPHFISIENDGSGKHLISVTFVEYKLFFVQQQSDMDFGIRPLGVSGIIVIKDGDQEYVVFAQRSEHVTEYPLCWELVPSGSLDRECVKLDGDLDFTAKLLAEFTEETGLSKDIVENINSCAVMFDKKNQVYDVCCKMEIKDFPTSNFKKGEYCSFRIIRLSEVRDFILSCQDSLVPASQAMAEMYLTQK